MKQYIKIYISIGIIVLLLALVVYQSLSLQSIKKQLGEIQSNSYIIQEQLEGSISDINNGIQTTLYDELGKSHLTKDVSITFNRNIKDGYELVVRAELSKINTDSKVIFMYKDVSANAWNEIELRKINELSYIGNIDILNDKSYEYKVITKGSLSESGDVEPIDKYEFIPSPPDISNGWSKDEILLIAYINSYDGEVSKNNIKSMDAIVGFEGKEKNYKCKYKEEEMIDGDEVENNRFYEVSIAKDDYNRNLDYIKLKITYKNGMIDVIDVTETVKSEE